MKIRHSFLVILAFLFFQMSLAQTEIAVFAGSQFNRFQEDISDFPEEDLTPQIRYHFGARVVHQLSENFHLRTSLAFIRKGTSYDYEGSEEVNGDWEFVDGYDRYYIDYLHLPVQLAYSTGNFSFYAGPYAGIALRARNKYDVDFRVSDIFGDNRIQNFSGDEKIKPIFRKVKEEDYEDNEAGFIRGLDLGMDLGLSYRLGKFELSVFYIQGLRNIAPKEEGYEDVYDDAVIRNQNFGLSLAYFIKSGTEIKDE